MYYLKLIWTFFRIGILNEMAYRVNFYVQLLQSLLSLGTAIAGLAIVFSHTDTLGGWQAVDILALLGVFMVVGGVIGMVINPSMSQLMDDVRLGLFDYTSPNRATRNSSPASRKSAYGGSPIFYSARAYSSPR